MSNWLKRLWFAVTHMNEYDQLLSENRMMSQWFEHGQCDECCRRGLEHLREAREQRKPTLWQRFCSHVKEMVDNASRLHGYR